MNRYEIGSILYLIPDSGFMAIPVQVVEEVIRKSIEGESVDHYVSVPSREEPVLLREINAEIFEELEEVRSHLLQLATSKVEKIINQTDDLASKNFEIVKTTKPKPKKKRSRKSKDKETATSGQVDIGGGQKANIIVNDELREILS